ncbi:MAG: redoxin domain-containing protein [Candidatus Nitrosopolaris sp.]
MTKSYSLYKTIWRQQELMIRDHSDILVAIIAIIGLVLAPAMYFLGSSVKATPSREGQTSSTTLTVLPLVQNGNTQNHFVIDKSQFKKAPEFTGVTGFVNTPAPIKLADLRGKVVLVHFWTYTCSNCIHTIPYLNDWYQKYSNKGLVIVGVQTPEFDDEKNIDNVKTAVNGFQIKYPVILDNNYANWNAYGNNYWPRDYLVDNQGDIRYSHIGEGGYDQTEQMTQSLLAEGVTSK